MSKIMIVDDDPHIRELCSVFLHNAGFEALEACDGVDALAQLDSWKVDLFIIDIMMPNMDGWGTVSGITGELRPANPDAWTAKGETSQKIKGLSTGHGRLSGQAV